MSRFEIPDHPVIACMERTGYPSWMREDYGEDGDYDRDAYEAYCDSLYEQRRERELFGD